MVTAVSQYQHLFSSFKLPPQDAKKLSFCGTKPKQLNQWLEQLNIDNKQRSIVFYKLLPEINQLDIAPGQRLALLSCIRPHVHQCIASLAKDFFNQPLSMTESMNKMAAIAQALQRHICDGYLITIQSLLQQSKFKAADKEILSPTLFYAAHGLSQLLYRNYQLYVPRPPMLWLKLHLIYTLAKEHQLENAPIADELLLNSKSLSVKHLYIRALVLDCSHGNQLRQIDIEYLYKLLEKWAPMVSLMAAKEGNDHLYWVDPEADNGPFYQSRYHSQPNKQDAAKLYSLNLEQLKTLINSHQPPASDSKIIEIPIHIRQSLLAHLRTCWQQEQQRHHPRQQSNIELEICIGLKSVHQQLLGDSSFEEFLSRHGRSEALNGNSLTGLDANTLPPTANLGTSNTVSKQEFIHAVATDISDEGYCLRWDHSVPPQIKSGEIILLRQSGSLDWQLGAIRWTQRLNRHSYVGVQLLLGEAFASATSTTLDGGTETPFFRTVLIQQRHQREKSSIITPIIPFAPQQKIQLQTENEYKQGRLKQLILSSGSISQFYFQSL